MMRQLMILGLMALFAFLLGCAFMFAQAERNEWRRYIQQHECVKTGQTRDDVSFITVSDGNGSVMMVPDIQTEYEWRCDSGIFWR